MCAFRAFTDGTSSKLIGAIAIMSSSPGLALPMLLRSQEASLFVVNDTELSARGLLSSRATSDVATVQGPLLLDHGTPL
jgi:hypothetical protein